MELAAFAACVLLILVLVRRIRWRRSAPTRPPSATDSASDSEQGFLAASKRLRLFEFMNVIVADERGSTEIDVIVVGNAGVFVIEIKDFNAWVFGNEHDEKWTAVYPDQSKHPFPNPLRQNFRHLKALETRLAIPPESFQSIVAFTGRCELKTPMPRNVITGDYRSLIESAGGITLTDSEVIRICHALDALKASSTPAALETHVAELKARYSSTTNCPKCGAALVERRSRKATATEAPFLGCKAFPRCRYTRPLDAT
jgi:hypothetical protein